MARVLIAVEDPMTGDNPMLLNEYVRVAISGAPVEEAYQLPRSALHEDRFVWLATPKGALEIRAVDVVWRDAESVIVSGGVNEGERLILTNLSTPINGMKLRIEGEPGKDAKGDKAGAGAGKGKGKGRKPHGK